ncbi:MAG: hypothetical protein GQ557_02800 [Mycoplasmataceae bacterium]|nr:hypothetical protein [Mycoplasmataceae bacterium]
MKKEIDIINFDALDAKYNNYVKLQKKKKIDDKTGLNVANIKDEINFLKTKTSSTIFAEYENTKKLLNKPSIKNIYLFYKNINSFRLNVLEAISSFLSLNFKLNEALLNYDKNFHILNQLKNLLKKQVNTIKCANFIEIRESSKLSKKIISIKNLIINLENSLILNKDIDVNIAKSIVEQINILADDFYFINYSLNYLSFTYKKELEIISGLISVNWKAINNIKSIIDNKIRRINKLRNTLMVDAKNFKKSKTLENIEILKMLFTDLKTQLKVNSLLAEYIIIENQTIFKEVKFYKNYHNVIISEIKRLNLKNGGQKIDKLNNYYDSLEKAVNNYLKSLNNYKSSISKTTTFEVIDHLYKMLTVLKINFNYSLKIQKLINDIITSTDSVNEIIAEINTVLLNVDFQLNKLPNNFQIIFTSDINKYDKKLNFLMLKFRESVKFVNDEKIQSVKKTLNEVQQLYKKISSQVFILFYIENLVIELNKYIYKSLDFQKQLMIIEKTFHMNENDEVLRLSKKILGNFNINE